MNLVSPLAIVDHLLTDGIPLIVIGGHAVNVHGFARATEDIDLIFRRSPESEQQLAESLTRLGAYWIGNEIDPMTQIETVHPVTLPYIQQTHLMMLGTDLGFLDLFDFIPSIPQEPLDDLFSTAIYRQGRPFASLAWIRRMKEAAGRPIDQLDLENLPSVD